MANPTWIVPAGNNNVFPPTPANSGTTKVFFPGMAAPVEMGSCPNPLVQNPGDILTGIQFPEAAPDFVPGGDIQFACIYSSNQRVSATDPSKNEITEQIYFEGDMSFGR